MSDARALPSPTGIRRGEYAYVAGVPGFYVVNPETNIAVGAFLEREEAEAHAARLERQYPCAPVKMMIVELQEVASA